MNKILSLLCLAAAIHPVAAQQKARLTETMQTVRTYPFSDPNPVANPSDLFYPYFRFDGFSEKGHDKEWKVVELENDYIQVSLLPEIGGKIWGAVDKTSGKEFIYQNHVVKFRDIAMRGPWTSGGIEFNFGIIGHAPTTSTPVDYLTRQKDDGSVSCYLSSYDWITRTWWTVEVNLPKDKAYFTTTTTWHNASSLDQPYYQWMNAGYKAEGNAQFCYPGTHYIGHGGDTHSFPLDEEGRDLSWYRNNNFESSKSYHVLGKYNDFYGVYWHDSGFGSIHHAAYDEKLGMKIFLWSLARDGEIWEDLLTDRDGQYIELQSGRMYNQPASNSGFTPYKHTAFGPQATDSWTEYWFPVKETRGVVKANRTGALNVVREAGFLKLYFSPLQQLSTELKLYDGEKLLRTLPLHADVLKLWKDSLPLGDTGKEGQLKVVIGNDWLTYSESPADNVLQRPVELPADFNWDSAYGLYTQGEQWMNQKEYEKAEKLLKASLEKEPYFVPALTALGSLYYRQGRYEKALKVCKTALSIDTYRGETNYLYGLCNRALGYDTDAKDGFSIATRSPSICSAAYVNLAEMFMRDQDWDKAGAYALKGLEYNQQNLTACQILMTVYRKSGRQAEARALISKVLADYPLLHAARFEHYLSGSITKDEFKSLIRNELPSEVYLELADWYASAGCTEEALQLLSFAENTPEANYLSAYLLHKRGEEAAGITALEKANGQLPAFVYPFRPSLLKALEWAGTTRPDWKINYYRGLIYWANQDKEKALTLFNTCDKAGYAPLFLSRALLKEGDARLADLQKAEQTESSWRTGFALINFYTAANRWTDAVDVGKRYMKQYPENYYIGLKYAKALCETGQYQSCLTLLDNLQVLPNEGAYAGRAVYRAANLYQAIELLNRGNYKQAVQKIRKSEEWPENLGVGKPYDNRIDHRFESYIEAKTCQQQGNRQKAIALFEEIITYKPENRRFGSANLLNALALRELSYTKEADSLVASWETAHPDNQVAQWCIAIYRNDKVKAQNLLDVRSDTSDTTPWESGYKDADFDLIVRMFGSGK